jgi:hypothetical protein
MTRQFLSRPREERAASLEAKQARFLAQLAREIEALDPATKPPPSPRDRAMRRARGRWPTGKEHPKARPVRTPAGVFDSVSQASKAFDLPRQHAARLACKRRDGWGYVDVGS